jgi:hypothetical protein
MKLGCNLTPKTRLARVPQLLDYLELPLIADSCDYAQRMVEPWGMLGNDKYGCCVFSAFAHDIQAKSVNAQGAARKVTTEQVLGWYSAVTGFDPSDPSTDNGTVPLDALQHLYRKGEIVAYGRVDIENDAHVAAAIELFGSLYSAWDLPLAWQGAGIWDIGPSTRGDWAPGSWGGHMTNQVSYSPVMNMTTITWGAEVTTTSAARQRYCSEAYVLITPEWFDDKGSTIQGFDLAGLKARLALVV